MGKIYGIRSPDKPVEYVRANHVHTPSVSPGLLLSRRSIGTLRLSQGRRVFEEHVKRFGPLEGVSLQAQKEAYCLRTSLQEIHEELLGFENPRAHALLIGEPACERSLVLSFLLPEKAHVRDRLLQGGVLGERTQEGR